MDCRGFEAWLDAGRPRDSAADAHAAGCRACADLVGTADDLEGALAQRFATAPAGFADRVMASLPPLNADAPLRIPEDRESPWPWWIQILFEPSSALGLALALAFALAAPSLIGTGREAVLTLMERFGTAGAALPEITSSPGSGLAIVLSAAIAVGSMGLFHGSIRLFARLTRLRTR
jgi:hypothetical protein